MVEKLNYMTVTRPNITFTISVVSQFLTASRTIYLEVVMRILEVSKESSRERASLLISETHSSNRLL